MTVAAIDLGTTSTRIAIGAVTADVTPPKVLRRSVLTTMADGPGGTLSDAGLSRVRAALEEFQTMCVASGVDEVVVVATAAARAAPNVDRLQDLVAELFDVALEVLTGDREAELTFAGALRYLDASEHSGSSRPAPDAAAQVDLVVSIDIGGGSTEISLGSRSDGLIGTFSADIGASVVTDTYLESDPPRADELSAALSVIQLHLDDAVRELPALAMALETGIVVGSGGTLTTVAAVELGSMVGDESSVEGFVLDRAAAEDVFRTLATEALTDRVHNPGLAVDRAPIIVGGCAILIEAMRHLDLSEIHVTHRDLLDGLLAEAGAE